MKQRIGVAIRSRREPSPLLLVPALPLAGHLPFLLQLPDQLADVARPHLAEPQCADRRQRVQLEARFVVVDAADASRTARLDPGIGVPLHRERAKRFAQLLAAIDPPLYVVGPRLCRRFLTD